MKWDRNVFVKLFFILIFCQTGSVVFGDSLEKIAKKICKGAQALQNKKTAVLPFPHHDGKESQGSTIVSERLTTMIAERKKLEIIERSLLEKVLKELKLQSSGVVDEESAKQIGKILGVDAIVTGTLIDLDDKKVEVNARLIKTETGQIIAAASGNIERFWKESESPAKETQRLSSNEELKKNDSHPADADPDCAECLAEEQASIRAIRPPLMTSNENSAMRQFPPPPPVPAEHFEKQNFPEPEDQIWNEFNFFPEMNNNSAGQDLIAGFRMLKQNEGVRAQEHFERLRRESPEIRNPKIDAVIDLGHGISLFKQGRKEDGVQEIRKVAELDQFPRVSAVAHFILGRLNETMGRNPEAQKHYLESVRKMPFQTPLGLSAGRRARALNDQRNKRQEIRTEMRRR